MENHKKLPRSSPVFGMLSVVFPLLGVPFAYVYAHGPSSQAGWGMEGAVIVFGIYSVSFLLGIISAIVGMVRLERFLVLPVIGFFLNGYPIFYFLRYLN